MSRAIMQQALEKYLSKEMPAGTEICDPLWWASRIAKELEAELAKPEPKPDRWSDIKISIDVEKGSVIVGSGEIVRIHFDGETGKLKALEVI